MSKLTEEEIEKIKTALFAERVLIYNLLIADSENRSDAWREHRIALAETILPESVQ